MQGTYFTPQHIGRGMIKQWKAMYMLTQIWGWHNTHTNPEFENKTKPPSPVQALHIYMYIYMSLVYAQLFCI